jgi:hypothetical protein
MLARPIHPVDPATTMMSRLIDVLRTHGWRDTLRRIRRKVWPDPDPAWLEDLRTVDADFDRQHGVDTGMAELRDLSVVSDNKKHGVRHIGVPPTEFQLAFDALPVNPAECSFVDIGAGKGRALLLASKHPFQHLVGVEFARELVDAAQVNLRHLQPRVELLCRDATEYVFPEGPLVVFLYNPFGAEVMRRVVQRAVQAPGPVWVMYLNPLEEACWTDAGFRRVANGPTFSILTR